jgi:formate dehydrogenase major subunit
VLARERGIENGDLMTVMTERAEITVRAMVSPRISPLKMGDRTVHQVCMPFHWGWGGPGVKGDAVNDLIALSGDPNVAIQESKAFVCDVRAGGGATETARLANMPPGDPVRVDDDHFAEERPQA